MNLRYRIRHARYLLGESMRRWWFKLHTSRWPFVMKRTLIEARRNNQDFYERSIRHLKSAHAAELDAFRERMAPVLDRLMKVRFGHDWRVPVITGRVERDGGQNPAFVNVNGRADYVLELALSTDMLRFSIGSASANAVRDIIAEVSTRISRKVERDMTIFIATGKIPPYEDEG